MDVNTFAVELVRQVKATLSKSVAPAFSFGLYSIDKIRNASDFRYVVRPFIAAVASASVRQACARTGL